MHDSLSVAVSYISTIFAENKKAKEFKDDFVGAFIAWIRPLFLKDDPELVEALENNANDDKTKSHLETRLKDLLKDSDFQNQLDEWMQRLSAEPIKERNIFTAGQDLSGVNLRVGDKAVGNDDYDRKNIVSIQKGNFSGDIIIGDGH